MQPYIYWFPQVKKLIFFSDFSDTAIKYPPPPPTPTHICDQSVDKQTNTPQHAKKIINLRSNCIERKSNTFIGPLHETVEISETGSRSPCMRPRSDPPKMKNSNVVRSRLINNKANWTVSNSAKLDSRTKQHTQSGVSTSDGSRDIAATKSWRGKKRKKF